MLHRLLVCLLIGIGIYSCQSTRPEIASTDFIRSTVYQKWRYASEIQLHNRTRFSLSNGFFDVPISVPIERADKIPLDIRLVQKRDFNQLVKEIPFQIYGFKKNQKTASFRIAFHAGVHRDTLKRFALFYNNPNATRSTLNNQLFWKETDNQIQINNFYYQVVMAKETKRITVIDLKHADKIQKIYEDPKGQFLADIIPAGAESQTTFSRKGLPPDKIIGGPVFYWIKGARHLIIPGQASADAPSIRLDFQYVFFSELPYFLVKTKLTFLRTVSVFEIRQALLTVNQDPFTHYFFRPYSKKLALTEYDEVGYVSVRKKDRNTFNDGSLMAGILPLDLGWQAVVNNSNNNGFAVTSISLKNSLFGRDKKEFPIYRPATRAFVKDKKITWATVPIFASDKKHKENATLIPEGAVLEESHIIHFGKWDQAQWHLTIEKLGKNLHNPLDWKVFPENGIKKETDSFDWVGQPRGNRPEAFVREIR